MDIQAKICGIRTAEAAETAEAGGAKFLGFVFYPPSPRNVTPRAAANAARNAKAKKVAVVVDASDKLLDEIMKELNPDYIQLHGMESDERAHDIKEKYGVRLIRSRHPDSAHIAADLYDFILVDSPKGALPGGNGIPFDWVSFRPPSGKEWFLSGGLNVDNLADAVKITGASMVDVSSGVESAPGVKDANKITAFLKKLNDLA